MIIVLLVCVLLAMVIWQAGYYLWWKKELSVTVSFQQAFVYVGEQAELTEVVENKKRLPVVPIEVSFQTQRGIRFQDMENIAVSDYIYKRDIFALLGNQRITRRLIIDCEKRGCYDVKDISIATFSILHERKFCVMEESETQLYVYAKRTNVSAILRMIENLLGEKESNRRYLEDPFLFSSIRNYTIQDPMKRINWKASAKTGGVMVNTFDSPKNERMMIYLDIEDSGILKKEHLVEDSISVAATLFQKLLSQGTTVGICINLYDAEKGGVFYLPPTRKKSQETILEQRLAGGWSEKEVFPFEKLLEYPFGDMVPVIISKNFSVQRKKQLEEFVGKGQKGIWVLPLEKGDCPEAVSDNLLFVKREVYG